LLLLAPIIQRLLFISLVWLSSNGVHSYPNDPYLAYRPPFARSLPVQIVLTGVVFTLVIVLLIHLLFTYKYHWSLAPVNYVLQLSGVVALLISLFATMHVVLSSAYAESEKWPYMLSYIAVNVPPLDLNDNIENWTSTERAVWLFMTASTSVIIQVIIYTSRVFSDDLLTLSIDNSHPVSDSSLSFQTGTVAHLRPLGFALPESLAYFKFNYNFLGCLAFVSTTMQLLLIDYNNYLSANIIGARNVCNATLSLLFTSSLFIWGFLVNRKQAWRTDGGTAIFGGSALFLALVSTSLNFLYVHKENEFVWLPGLMWAVVLWQSFLGWWWWVGAGSGSGFATEDEYRAEKLRREAKRASRKRKAKKKREEKKIKTQNAWQGVTSVFALNTTHPFLSRIRSRTPFGARHISSDIEASVRTEPHTAPYCQDSKHPITPLSSFQSETGVGSDPNPSISASESVVSQSNLITSILSLPRTFPGLIYRWYISLRRAHVAAARRQTAERVGVDQQNSSGGFGWRRRIRVTPTMEVNEAMTKSEDEDEQDPHMVVDWRTKSSGGGGITPVHGELEGIKNQKLRTDHDCQEAGSNHEMPQGRQQNMTLPFPVTARPSMSWWRPLGRWRLQDSTVY
jgi:hypothetical protein